MKDGDVNVPVDKQKLIIFDTTLRDGEQSPGATLNIEEKLEIARQLSRLGVDVCEAGFPIASPGDFEAVRRIAEEVGPLTEGRRVRLVLGSDHQRLQLGVVVGRPVLTPGQLRP